MYSPHVYGPDVFGQPYFNDPQFPHNMPDIWKRHFGYALRLTLHAACCNSSSNEVYLQGALSLAKTDSCLLGLWC